MHCDTMLMKYLMVKCTISLVLLMVMWSPYEASIVQDQEYWYEQARVALRRRLQYLNDSERRARARNVLLFVGDGMGLSTATAARILRGQRLGRTGEDHELAWDTFPSVALAKTYNSDAQIGESSACATALMCGVKTNFETVGLDSRGRFENCFSSFSSRVSSLIDWAQQSGKATGIVTNTRITHATPAALYAHSPSRYWEDDSKVPPAARKSCKDITKQLIENDPGRNINVLLGGGRRHWLPKVARDPELTSEEGRRLDGRNMIDDWVRDKKRRGLRAEYVWNKGQMDEVNPRQVDYLLGLFAYSHMDFEADRDTGPKGDPSLAEMTRKALSILLKNPKGFFLFVEGGRIDHAHHYNNAYRALDETLAMETALLAALAMVDPSETLVVLTADHSHVMTLGGQATPRGHPVLEIPMDHGIQARIPRRFGSTPAVKAYTHLDNTVILCYTGPDSKVSDVDGLSYSTILYGNGPGYSVPRIVPANTTGPVTPRESRNVVHASAAPRQWATHGGEDVPVYTLGPHSKTLFTGIFDQSYIPHAIAYASCIGEHEQRCSGGPDKLSIPNASCAASEVNSISAPGVPVVVASSVMVDDSKRNKSSGAAMNSSIYLTSLLLTSLVLIRIKWAAEIT